MGGHEEQGLWIGGVNVAEAVDQKDKIVYALEQPPTFKEGDEVDVKIDWDYRFRIMRVHSATHIVFKFVKEKIPNLSLIGSNISVDKGRIDFNYPDSIGEMLPELAEKANALISESKEIRTYDDPENPGRRWWEIEGFDKMPCGGTHVASTGEIGPVSVTKIEKKGKHNRRVNVALADA